VVIPAKKLRREVSGCPLFDRRVTRSQSVKNNHVYSHILQCRVSPAQYCIMRNTFVVVLGGDFKAVHLTYFFEPYSGGDRHIHVRRKSVRQVRTVYFEDRRHIGGPAWNNTEFHVNNTKNMLLSFRASSSHIADTRTKSELI
jgi:hypothetical protein